MASIDELREYGVNVDEGLKRCMNNEALYMRLISTIPTEPNFTRLKDAFENGDTEEAFEAVHALKGVLGNLSITPLFEKANELTELLRGGAAEGYKECYEELMELKADFSKLF